MNTTMTVKTTNPCTKKTKAKYLNCVKCGGLMKPIKDTNVYVCKCGNYKLAKQPAFSIRRITSKKVIDKIIKICYTLDTKKGDIK